MDAIKNLPASVLARLRNKARETNRPFDQVLRYYAFERFLYRLSQSKYRDQFILKGALLLSAWPMSLSRTTSDIDFTTISASDLGELNNMVTEICMIQVHPDALRFDADSIQLEQLVGKGNSRGARIRFWGYVAKARIRMQLDVGFSDEITPRIETVDYPTLLDMPAAKLLANPKETVVAEKLDAIVQLGEANSRMKDFFDLWHLSRTFVFDSETLVKAIGNTFGARTTRIPVETPIGLTEEFATANQAQWQAFLARIGNEDEQLTAFTAVVLHLREFALPPLHAAGNGERFVRMWTNDETWQ
jgi:predicted nucleotidyltransferase component of viral defense system